MLTHGATCFRRIRGCQPHEIKPIAIKGSYFSMIWIIIAFICFPQFSCYLKAEENKAFVIFLNGTSSAGKSSIAIKLLEQLHDPFLRVGVDWYIDCLNPKFLMDGENADQGYKFISVKGLTTVKKGSLARRLDDAAHNAMKIFLQSGFNLIVDEVLFDDKDLKNYLSVFQEYCVYFIFIKPPIEVAEHREIERGDRVLGLARGLYDEVYSNKICDLEIDSAKLTPEESAKVIIDFIKSNANPTAFKSHQKKFASFDVVKNGFNKNPMEL